MRFASRITKSTDTQSQYVILIVFPLQQRSGERALILRYTYNVRVVRLYVANCIIDEHQHMHFFTFKTVLV